MDPIAYARSPEVSDALGIPPLVPRRQAACEIIGEVTADLMERSERIPCGKSITRPEALGDYRLALQAAGYNPSEREAALLASGTIDPAETDFAGVVV